MSRRYRLGVGSLIPVVLVAGVVLAGDLTPPGPPGATMKTLQEIYDKQDSTHQLVEAFVPPQTPSATTTVVNAGYYQAADLAIVEPDLSAENIKEDVTIFGVTGTHEGGSATSYAVVQKTGQTTSFQAGDDGDYQKGVAIPGQRFSALDDYVLDSQTDLIWARNANLDGAKTWSNAVAYCEGLNYGGLTDWRLPNLRELQSLLDYGRFYPALPAGHPFMSVERGGYYWSSTTRQDGIAAWRVCMLFGEAEDATRNMQFYVWPVHDNRYYGPASGGQ